MTQVSISDVWLPPDGVHNEVATSYVLHLAIDSCATMYVGSGSSIRVSGHGTMVFSCSCAP
jgi:hypothetical protein